MRFSNIVNDMWGWGRIYVNRRMVYYSRFSRLLIHCIFNPDKRNYVLKYIKQFDQQYKLCLCQVNNQSNYQKGPPKMLSSIKYLYN